MSQTQTFSALTTRANGRKVLASWWNTIKNAGTRLEEIFGLGLVPQTQQSFTDGMSATNLTGASFAPASYTGFKIRAKSYRDDGTNQRAHIITITGIYNSKKAEWRLDVEETGESCTSGACASVGSGLTFTMSTNQVQFASDTMGGSHTGKLNWKVVETFTAET